MKLLKILLLFLTVGPAGFEIPVLCVVGDLKRKPGRFIKHRNGWQVYDVVEEQLNYTQLEFLCFLVKLLFLQQLVSLKCYLDRFAVTLT